MTKEEIEKYTNEEALKDRENWERCAANAYQLLDNQVLAFIDEIRTLRKQLVFSNTLLEFYGK